VIVITINESAKLAECFERILAKLSFERSKIRLLNDGTHSFISLPHSFIHVLRIDHTDWFIDAINEIASFLCYSFVDAVVDYTFPILEKYARRINWLEKDMVIDIHHSMDAYMAWPCIHYYIYVIPMLCAHVQLSFEPTQEHMDESGVIKANLLGVRMNLWRLRELLTELIQVHSHVHLYALRITIHLSYVNDGGFVG
jgi:Mg2+ and Co2+ transporter CorA